jgi:hypothetical protein
MKYLKFYDKQGNCSYQYDGEKDGQRYCYYQKYQGEYPAWAKEAQKTLED